MNIKAILASLVLAAALVSGCTTSQSLNELHIGMTKDQVIALLGKPDSTSAQANVEYLTFYLLADSGYGRDQPYMVRLVNGKVESFGRFAQLFDLYNRPVTSANPGDPNFPTSGLATMLGAAAMPAPPAAVTASNQSPVPVWDLAGQIQRLKALRDSGVLTEDEFQKAKAKVLGDTK